MSDWHVGLQRYPLKLDVTYTFLAAETIENLTELNSFQARRHYLRHFKVPRFQGSKVPRFQGSKVPRFQGFEVPRFQGTVVNPACPSFILDGNSNDSPFKFGFLRLLRRYC